MAAASLTLVRALRRTADRLATTSARYDWAHFAHCNCGQLAQTITGLAPSEIFRAASEERGDWAEQAFTFVPPDYGDRPALDEGAWEPRDLGRCEVTEQSMSSVFGQLRAAGLTASDIGNLERLSDAEIRRYMGNNTVEFPFSRRQNVIDYLRAWADLLEGQLPAAELDTALATAAE